MEEINNKTNEANKIVKQYASGAAGVGIVPVPLLDLALRVLEELAHLTCGRRVESTRPERIDEVPIARLGGNPARARVR